jgi:hypothetical protein
VKIFPPPAQRPVRDAQVNNVWRNISTPPHALMIKGLNFTSKYFRMKPLTFYVEPIPHPNDVSLDNAGLLSATKGKAVFLFSQDKPEYTGGPNLITILRFSAKFSRSEMTKC